jgi:hypothetical protein
MDKTKQHKRMGRVIARILHALRIFQHDGPSAEAGSCNHFEECEPHDQEDDDYEPTNYFGPDGRVGDRK